jgi:hypothetical protein
MAHYLLEAVPHIIHKTRQQYEDVREELLREYRAFLRYSITTFPEIRLHLRALPTNVNSPPELTVTYELPGITPSEAADFLKYALTLRKFLRLKPLNIAEESHFTGSLGRRVNLLAVGSVDVAGAGDLHIMPTDAYDYLNFRPQLAAGHPIQVVINPVNVILGEIMRKHIVPEQAYLVPVPQPLEFEPGPTQWRGTLTVLNQLGGTLTIACQSYQPCSADLEYAFLCLQYFLGTMKEKLSSVDIDKQTTIHRALMADESICKITVAISGNSTIGLGSLGRDFDPLIFEETHKSRLTKALQDSFETDDHPARAYAQYFTMAEALNLLLPPYTFRDALPALRHFVPKPFQAPALIGLASGNSIHLGHLDSGGAVAIPKDSLTRHTFVSGTTGSGKTFTIKYLLDQIAGDGDVNAGGAERAPVLIIDPVKRDFEDFIQDRFGPDRIIDFGKHEHLYFNPFLPADNTRLYAHSVVLAKTLAMIFPTNAVAYDIILSMVKGTYLWTLSGRPNDDSTISTTEFLLKTGRDLRADPTLTPTFAEFLERGLHTLSKPARQNDRVPSQWLLEAIEHFERQWENLRNSALYEMFSEPPSDDGDGAESGLTPLQPLFSYSYLIEFTNWQDEREINAAFALIFAMLYEHRLSAHEDLPLYDESGRPILRHLAVLDEAHRIFPADTTAGDNRLISPAREASTLLSQMMAECRGLGQGVIVAEQSASKINPDALINSATKVIHTILHGRDKEYLGSSLSLASVEQDYLSFLDVGDCVALVPDTYQPLFIHVGTKAT